MREHRRADVSLLVLEGEVVDGHARARQVLDLADVLLVGRVLALSRHPHHLAQLGLVVLVLGVVDQGRGGAGLLEGDGVLVRGGLPAEDLRGK